MKEALASATRKIIDRHKQYVQDVDDSEGFYAVESDTLAQIADLLDGRVDFG